jgi:molecular chaperone GrpE
MKKVIGQFFEQLQKDGLEKIEPKTGEILDTNLHEVLIAAEGKAGTIVQTLEAGWKYKEMVISPAKVSAASE